MFNNLHLSVPGGVDLQVKHESRIFRRTCKPPNLRRQSTQRPRPVQTLLTSAAPSSDCNSMRSISDFHDTLRLPMPHGRTSTSRHRNRNRRPKVCPPLPRSSTRGYLCITKRTRDQNQLPMSTLGCTRVETTTITRCTTSAICSGRAALTTY